MLDSFTPDFMFDSVFDIEPELFASLGVRGVILDIDNTLVPYTEPQPTRRVLDWLEQLAFRGIACAFVSNNDRERVELFNRELGYFAVHSAGKPSSKAIRAAIDHFGLDKSQVVLVGDQVFTDVWSARRAGITVMLVSPIESREDLFFRLKRWGEKPFRRRYLRRVAKCKNHSEEGEK